MFSSNIGKPTKLKKVIYLIASVVLGLLLSFNAHALLEVNYLRWAEKQNKIVKFYGSCALPEFLQIILIALGAVGGFYFGKFWWRKIYIERCLDKTFKKI